jgi:hypothetical protein
VSHRSIERRAIDAFSFERYASNEPYNDLSLAASNGTTWPISAHVPGPGLLVV